MDNYTQNIIQLNNYPRDRYNVLIPVTSMQAMNNLQKIIVNEVRLDPDPNGNDVYYDKQTSKLAITAIGGTKLAAAANISVISSASEQPEVCRKCVDMARATGNAPKCGDCDHCYDTKYTVTIRVPEPSGGFRTISKSKEIDCTLEKKGMSDAQFRRFLPHRASMAETKAYMRCIRSALGLAQGYTREEIERPFIIAHIVPNLDSPDIRKALISNSLRDMGLLFERPSIPKKEPGQDPQGLQTAQRNGSEAASYGSGNPGPRTMEPDDGYQESDYMDGSEEEGLPWDDLPDQEQPEAIQCASCGRQITETTGKNGQPWTPEAIKAYSEKRFGMCLCTECQKQARNNNNNRR